LRDGQEIKSFTATISPASIFETSFDIPADLDETELQIVVTDNKGVTLVSYQPEKTPSWISRRRSSSKTTCGN